MDNQHSLDLAISIVVFTLLFLVTIFLMNVAYSFAIGALVGVNGVVAYLLLFGSEDLDTEVVLRFKRCSVTDWTILLHILVFALWLFVPATTALLFASWWDMPQPLLLRGIIAFAYAIIVPGVALVRLLDPKRQLTLLEVAVFGCVFSIFFLSFSGYIAFTLNLSLTLLLFPIVWIATTFLLLAGKVRSRMSSYASLSIRPPSFPTTLTRGLLCGTVALLLLGILTYNIAWGTPIGGDLWTHFAQAAYFAEGYNTVTYPWGYHFLLVALWAVSGLPIANVGQLLQSLTIIPVLALFIAVSAYTGRKSKVPAMATLIYAVFMGLGWISYIYLRGANVPASPASLYDLEYQASAFMYDITVGVFNFRVVFLPETIALSALILGIRLLRGFTMTTSMILFSALIVTFTSMTSHIFETSFFILVLLIAVFFRADRNNLRILFLSEIGAGGAFLILYLVDALSPEPQRIFISTRESFYFLGFVYPIYALMVALTFSLGRIILSKKSPHHNIDLVEWISSRFEKAFGRFERRLTQFTIAIMILLGIFFGLYKVLSVPVYAWQTLSTGQVPWNDYPLRLGIATFFVLLGGVILLMRRDAFGEYFEFLALAVTALFVGRALDFFGPRPVGFGEYRVMDILWLASAPLAAYGLIELTKKTITIMGRSQQRTKIVGGILIFLVILTGASSFVVLIDAKVELALTPGYVATPDDLQVMNYLLTHGNEFLGLVTSPTPLSQYKVRALTLTYPMGYSNPAGVLPFFLSDSILEVLDLAETIASLRIFISSYDISALSSSQYQPVLWYLAYQPVVFDAGTSFLVSPNQLRIPSKSVSSPTIILNQNNSIGAYFSVLAFALSKTAYALSTNKNQFPSTGTTAILTADPTDQSTFNLALSWATNAASTLIVVANQSSPGLFETQFFRIKTLGEIFDATQLSSQSGTSTSQIDLPYPVSTQTTEATNATVMASFEGKSGSSPLAIGTHVGGGRVVFLSLRDYYSVLARNDFDEEGRALYAFLPLIFYAAGVPLNP